MARMFLIKCYGMLQNVRATAFTVFELLRENQHEGWVKLPPTHVRVNLFKSRETFFIWPIPKSSSYVFKLFLLVVRLANLLMYSL